VTKFGAVPGSGDPTDAIQSAVDSGKLLWFPSGTYTCTDDIVTGASLVMRGDNTTIVFSGNFKLDGAALTDSVLVDGITFDGNYDSVEAANLRGSKVVITNCSFTKVHGASVTTYGLAIGNITESLLVDNCRFLDITAIANGTIGDSAGAVRGISLRGTLPWGVISNCEFSSINNVAVLGGPKVFEDADAITCQPGAGVIQQGLIKGCSFIDCGKRALKLQLPTGSSWTVDDCLVESTWLRKTVESVDAAANTITITDHGFANGTRIEMHSTGALPTPLNSITAYHVVSSTTHTFQLSATSGGAAIDLTDVGSGTITAANTAVMGEAFSNQASGATCGSLRISNTILRGGGAQRFAVVIGSNAGGVLQIDNCKSIQEPRFFWRSDGGAFICYILRKRVRCFRQ
jgi:hypothetical protein